MSSAARNSGQTTASAVTTFNRRRCTAPRSGKSLSITCACAPISSELTNERSQNSLNRHRTEARAISAVSLGSERRSSCAASSRCCHGPAAGESWTESGADANIVVQVPQSRSPGARIHKQIIGFAVPVEIGRPDQIISCRNRWPICAADEGRSRQIPDRSLTRRRVEKQIIGLAVPVKIRNPHYAPARSKSWTDSTANANIVVHEPDHRLAGAGIVKDVIGL